MEERKLIGVVADDVGLKRAGRPASAWRGAENVSAANDWLDGCRESRRGKARPLLILAPYTCAHASRHAVG
jgi:hypothetical protein